MLIRIVNCPTVVRRQSEKGSWRVTTKSRMKTKQRGVKDIETYLGALPDDQQQALRGIRKAIQAAAPNAEEAFVYGVPGFKLNGKSLACYTSFKHHCGFYPMSPKVIRAHASLLKRYEISKGTIRFQANKPLSASLVKKLVRTRALEE